MESEQHHTNRVFTSDYSSEEEEDETCISNRPKSAREIYKQVHDDWWNVFPKTDYTYSQSSECRYEIAPGILPMPNMSRRSIHSNNSGSNLLEMTSNNSKRSEDISYAHTSNFAARASLCKKTYVEQYTSHKEISHSVDGNSSKLRQRCLPNSNTLSRFTDIHNTYEYDAENELNQIFSLSMLRTNQRWRIIQWFTYFATLIIIKAKKTIEFLNFRTNREKQYYSAHHSVQAHHSYHESVWSALWKSLSHCAQNIYFFFVKILVFDAWLLSQFTGSRKWLRKRSMKTFWIAFLPLLFIFGYWYVMEHFLPALKTVSEMTTEKLSSNIQWKELESRNAKEELLKSNNDLIGKIATVVNQQTYQMEYLMNITRVLEDRKQSDADFREAHDEKIVENKVNINKLTDELKIMRYEVQKLHELYSECKSCCNTEPVTNQDIEKHVENVLFSYLPPGTSKTDLAKNIQNLFAPHINEDQTALVDDVNNANACISEDEIRKIVKEILHIYNADKTGQADYALESAGGQIISTRCTQTYNVKSQAFSLFGFPLYYVSHDPRIVIQGNAVMQPGDCWAFQDFPGYLVIQLRSLINVTGFTLEHVPKSILPNGNISSAPKKFDVWGLTDQNDPKPVMFGEYEFTYEDNLQYFPVQNTEINRPYKFIELKIQSNYGNLDYTCLYRFRVHGEPV